VGHAGRVGSLIVARTLTLRDGQQTYSVVADDDGRVRVDGAEGLSVTPLAAGVVRIGTAPARSAWVAASGGVRWVFLDGRVFRFDVETKAGRRRARAHHGSLSAPMPATVIRIAARPGTAVKRGDTLIVLEAMKMELPIRAGADGVVTTISCREGELVQPGTTLIEIDEAES